MTHPALELLLQGYFHQDWMLDYTTPWAAVDDFYAGALGLVSHPHLTFDHEPTPEEVVDRALAYRPIAL